MTLAAQKKKADDARFPHSLDAEKAVLGTLLAWPERLTDVEDRLRADDFYREAHALIYEHVLRLHATGRVADFGLLREALTVAGQLERVGGPAYLSSLTDGIPKATNVVHYADVVRDKALRRDLIQAASDLVEHAHTDEAGADALAHAERAVLDISLRRSLGREPVDVQGLLQGAWGVVEQVQQTGRPVTGLATGFLDLDVLTRGMHPGQLISVAALTGGGKSTFALNLARHASRAGRVLFCSLEMDREELGVRLLVSEARVDGHALQSGHQLSHAQYSQIGAAMAGLGDSHLVVDDSPHLTLNQVRSLARRMRAAGGLVAIVIDYLQLLTPNRRRKGEEKRNLEIADITRDAKVLAKELRVPIVLLSQLNRAAAERKNNQPPELHDLAESSSIEKDSDQVWFIWVPDADEPVAEVLVRKNRGGPKGKVRLAYFEEQYLFANLAA